MAVRCSFVLFVVRCVLAIGHRLLVAVCWLLLFVGCWLFAVCCLLPAVCCSLCVARCASLVVCWMLVGVRGLLSVFVVCCCFVFGV